MYKKNIDKLKKVNKTVMFSVLVILLSMFPKNAFSQNLSFESCDTNNILNLAQRAYTLRYSKTDSSMIYARQGVNLSFKSYYLKGYLQNLNSLSTAYFAKGEFDFSEKLCRKTHLLAKSFNFQIIEGMALNNLANIYLIRDDKTAALNYYLDALSIFEKNNYENGTKVALLNIGLIYKSLKLHQSAKDYLLKSISLLNPEKDIDLVASFLFNFAVILRDEGNLIKSKELFILSLKYYGKAKSNLGLALAMSNLGELEIDLNNSKEGIPHIIEALYFANKSNNIWVIARSHLALGSYYSNNINDQNKAISHLLKAYQLAKVNNSFSYIFNSSDLLSKIYFKKNQTKKAYQFLREAMDYKDSIWKSEEKITVQNLQIRNDFDKNQEKLTITEKDNQKNKLIRNFFITGSFLLVILLASLYSLYKKILKQKKELQTVNATKDKLFSIISHELRSPFHILRGYLWMISNKVITLEQFQTTSGALTKEVDNIFLALENLLNWAKAQMNGIVLKPVTINAYELIADILKIYTELAKEKSIHLINNIPENLQFTCDRHHADLIIRNTLNNAVKFSNINGNITINSIVNKNLVHIVIQDQGVGISKDKIKNLFSIEKHFSETGTKGEKGTGLGLLLCKEFVEKNGGKIQIESDENQGTKVILGFMVV